MTNLVIPFKDIINKLYNLDDYTWGLYAIKQDILYRKVSKKQYKELIDNAIKCGEEYAQKVIAEVGSNDALEIADYYKIKITNVSGKPGGKKLIFASFTSPNKVMINKEPILKSIRYMKNLKMLNKDFTSNNVYNVLLAHELFHYVEDKYKKEIYTRNEKIVLWKLFGYEYKSTLRVLSEIAAMSFAKIVSNVNFSPFMLDIVMFYPYDNSMASKIFNNLLGLEKEFEEINNVEK